MDLSTEGYAKYERGDSSPNIMFLDKLSKVFNCTIVELITETQCRPVYTSTAYLEFNGWHFH